MFRNDQPIEPLISMRKGAYILATIMTTSFIALGAKKLFEDTEIYFIKKKYDGTSTGESCALLGIGKNWILPLLDNSNDRIEKIEKIEKIENEDQINIESLIKFCDNVKSIIERLRSHRDLQYIPGIKNLQPYNMDVLKSLKNYPNNYVNDNEVLLLNIEPEGDTFMTKLLYPNANITIPGGGLEKQDDNSFEKCSLREFREETGIELKSYGKRKKNHRNRFLKCWDAKSLDKGIELMHYHHTEKNESRIYCEFESSILKQYRKLFKHRIVGIKRDCMYYALRICP